MTNCPNCGAPITGYRCEYCETVFSDIKTEEDELTEMISDYCDGLDAWEKDYKRMLLDLQVLADECGRANKLIAWPVLSGAVFIIIIVLSVILSVC